MKPLIYWRTKMKFNIFKKKEVENSETKQTFPSATLLTFPKIEAPTKEQWENFGVLRNIREKYELTTYDPFLTSKDGLTISIKRYCEEMISIEYKPIEPFTYFGNGKKIPTKSEITELDNGLLKVKRTTKDKIIETTYNNWSEESKGIKRFISKADIKRVKDILKQAENWI